ncbi:hypothetical protein C5167_013885, partial [Papaver somniferum]
LLWISDDGVPELGGTNKDETCFADEVSDRIPKKTTRELLKWYNKQKGVWGLLILKTTVAGIHLARGNHESKNMNKIYGFEGEVKSKLSEDFIELFAEVFCCLPLAHVLNGKVFIVHGGLFCVYGIRKLAVNSLLRSNQINEIFLEHMNKLAFMRLVHVHLGFICSYQSIIAILYEGLTRHLKAKVVLNNTTVETDNPILRDRTYNYLQVQHGIARL